MMLNSVIIGKVKFSEGCSVSVIVSLRMMFEVRIIGLIFGRWMFVVFIVLLVIMVMIKVRGSV